MGSLVLLQRIPSLSLLRISKGDLRPTQEYCQWLSITLTKSVYKNKPKTFRHKLSRQIDVELMNVACERTLEMFWDRRFKIFTTRYTRTVAFGRWPRCVPYSATRVKKILNHMAPEHHIKNEVTKERGRPKHISSLLLSNLMFHFEFSINMSITYQKFVCNIGQACD